MSATLASCDSRTSPEEKGLTGLNARGKKLFQEKCASCHMVNKELTGPALAGAEARWPDSALLYAFIRNSDSVIQVNEYARKLWLQYNQTAMTAHPGLSNADIRAILDYVKEAQVKR
jgi:mono/diheme cytochrome c family protein